MVPLIKLYTIAFWKSYLEGDHRYMRYLTPGYAKHNYLEAAVEIENGKRHGNRKGGHDDGDELYDD